MASVIECRSAYEVNTDPQRRCYNGCHYSSEIVFGAWEVLDYNATEDRLKFWRELNADAVKARGESAKREFRIVDIAEAA